MKNTNFSIVMNVWGWGADLVIKSDLGSLKVKKTEMFFYLNHKNDAVRIRQEYVPCSVAISLTFLSLHQPHGSQGLPVSLGGDAALKCTMGPSPPVTVPPFSFDLHSDRLAILVHIVKLLSVSVVSRFTSFSLKTKKTWKHCKLKKKWKWTSVIWFLL